MTAEGSTKAPMTTYDSEWLPIPPPWVPLLGLTLAAFICAAVVHGC